MRKPNILKSTCWPLLICLVIFTAAACSSGSKQNPGQVFRMNMSSASLESLDPAFAKDLYMMWSSHMIYNTLVEANENLQLSPSLAKRWEISEDRLTYTFYLRNDVYFHDALQFPDGKGRRMTAHDVVYSFNRIIDPAVASYGAWIFNDRVADREPFKAINDTTLQIRLIRPFQPFPVILSMPYCSVVPKEVVEHWGKDYRSHPCGTGPFSFNYWDEGNILVLYKNNKYWEYDNTGARFPYVDALQITFVEARATEFFLFLQGKLDFVNGIDGSFKDLVLTKNGTLKPEYESRINLTKRTYLNTEYIGFLTDTLNPLLKDLPLANPIVRRAINYAIDRRKIVTYFRNGVGYPALAGFIPYGMPGYDTTSSYGYSYDPAKATALLAEAGYPNGKGMKPFKILTPDNFSDVVNFIAGQLQDIGIPAEVEILQPNVLRAQMSKSQALMFRALWIADYPDAESYLAVFNSRLPAPPNYTRFSNVAFDKLYDKSMLAPDSIRWQLYREMDSLAMSYAPVIPLFYDEVLHFTGKNISGLTGNPMNVIDLKRVRVNEPQTKKK